MSKPALVENYVIATLGADFDASFGPQAGKHTTSLSEKAQRNGMEISDFVGKPFACPVCNTALQIKITLKKKPYCMCLDCGIQIFFRGQAGIRRLHEMIRSEEAVAAEFDYPARAISIFNHLQHLKRQKKAFEEEQGIFSFDSDRQKVIDALDNEIARVREALEEAANEAEGK